MRYVALTPSQKQMKRDYKVEQLRRDRTRDPTGADIAWTVNEYDDWSMFSDWAAYDAMQELGRDATPSEIFERTEEIWIAWAETKIPGLLARIDALVGTEVERTVYLPPRIDPAEHEQLGIYWTVPGAGDDVTTYEDSDRELERVVYRARVDADNVDKWVTVANNLMYGLDKEAEVAFIRGAPLFVYSAETDTTIYEIDDWRRA